jgi:exodeoxyribonuclease V alpha subunit
LPSVETAWAMTVHKSQGSEFDDVLVVMPERQSRTMNRELLYTAVTRAKRGVTVMGSAGAVRAAAERVTGRMSGLRQRLMDG